MTWTSCLRAASGRPSCVHAVTAERIALSKGASSEGAKIDLQ